MKQLRKTVPQKRKSSKKRPLRRKGFHEKGFMEKTNGSKKKIFWGIGALLFIIIVFAVRFVVSSSDANSRRQGIALVKIQKPFRENVRSILSYTGDALPIQQAAIYAKVAGNLDRNYVEMGIVRASGTIACFDRYDGIISDLPADRGDIRKCARDVRANETTLG